MCAGKMQRMDEQVLGKKRGEQNPESNQKSIGFKSMRLKNICFVNPPTSPKSMEIVCVYCTTTDHIFKPDEFDEASLNSTNSDLRRTTARVSEQNIVQVWLVRSCEIL